MSDGSIESKARKVLASLVVRPSLFYEVARIIHDEYDLAGPWEQVTAPGGRDPEQWVRRHFEGEAVVQVVFHKSTDLWTWSMSYASGDEADMTDAQANADAALVRSGYMLSGS